MSLLQVIPQELLFQILSEIDVKDLLRVQCVSKEFQKHSDTNRLWQLKFNKKQYFHYFDNNYKFNYKTNHILANFANRPRVVDLFKNDFLNLYQLQVQKIPMEIKYLGHIKTLNLSKTDLTEYPKEINSLTNLENLYLDDNEITVLPDDIQYMVKLKRFDIPNNKLLVISDKINCLTNLRYLDLRKNNIEVIPQNFAPLTKLTNLYLNNNPLSEEYKKEIARNLKLVYSDL